MESLEFSLDQFEGSLDLLLALIQKQEIDLLSIPINELTQQLAQKKASIDTCSDSMSQTATLLLLKSLKLLPAEPLMAEDETLTDNRAGLIEQLIAFCRLKEASKELAKKEEKQFAHFLREPVVQTPQRPTGLTELSLQQLATHFQDLLKRQAAKFSKIEDEQWSVGRVIDSLKNLLKQGSVFFDSLFNDQKCQIEWIVTFLAILELMKKGELIATLENDQWILKPTS